MCDDTYTEEIPATGHTAGEWKTIKEATCTEDGEKQQVCSACGEVLDTKTIPATGHTAGEWEVIKKAGLFTPGEQVQKCTACKEIIKTETIPQTCPVHLWAVCAGFAVIIAIAAAVIIVKKRGKR